LSLAPDQVEVSIAIEEEQVTRDFDRIDVRARDFNGAYSVTPQVIHLRLGGPKSTMDKLQLSSDRVYLDLKGLSVGEHSVPLMLSLPADVTVLEQTPQRLKVRIIKPGE
jgi:YbbR domain-containing protein